MITEEQIAEETNQFKQKMQEKIDKGEAKVEYRNAENKIIHRESVIKAGQNYFFVVEHNEKGL